MTDLYKWDGVGVAKNRDYDPVRQAVEAFNLEFVTCTTIVAVDTGGGSLTHTNNSGLTTSVQVAAGTFTKTVELKFTQVPAATHLPTAYIDSGLALNLTAVISSTGKSMYSVSNPYQVAVRYDESQLGDCLNENWLCIPGMVPAG